MTGTAQGINKKTAYKIQTGLGAPATGAGGQIIRRTQSVIGAKADSFATNELLSHQQSTGVTMGVKKPAGKIDGVLSPKTYADWLGSLVRKTFATGVSATAQSITIALVSGKVYSVTRATGSFLTDGFKIGDVVRLSVGTFNAANLGTNLLVINVTALALNVRAVNGQALVAEGPISGATVAVAGKKTWCPPTGQTRDYYTIEDWYSDLSASELYTDQMIAQAALTLPATGNATISIDTVGRDRTLNASQQLTSPTAETTSAALTAVNGAVMVNGAVVANITSGTVTINGNTAPADPNIGSNIVDDMQRGELSVSGQFAAKFTDTGLQTVYENRTTTNIVLVIAADQTPGADFVTINLPMITLTDDGADDGNKAVIRTYPFTAKYNGAGGAGVATDQTIIALQDSAA